MDQSAILFIVLAGAAFLLIGVLATHSGGSLNGIKAKTVATGSTEPPAGPRKKN